MLKLKYAAFNEFKDGALRSKLRRNGIEIFENLLGRAKKFQAYVINALST
ncbi:hypothetical protein [Pyrobaculum islandicum]|nr:hypothetical protein [Pyrobaculum islandicum]